MAGFRELSDALCEDQPVFGLVAPVTDGAQPPVTVEEFAATYVREVRKLQSHGPYRLCGYSFGALIAFEMATMFAEAGEEVPVLALLDSTNLAYYRHMPRPEWLRFWATRLADRGGRYAYRIAHGQFDVILKSITYFVRKHVSLIIWRISRRRHARENPAVAGRESDKLTMSKGIARSYVPRTFSGRVIIFRPKARAPEYEHNASLGWKQVAGTGVDVHYISGDHLSFMRQPYVAEVARQLEVYLG